MARLLNLGSAEREIPVSSAGARDRRGQDSLRSGRRQDEIGPGLGTATWLAKREHAEGAGAVGGEAIHRASGGGSGAAGEDAGGFRLVQSRQLGMRRTRA